MQINYYMSKTDRVAFHQYLFSRGGYLTPQEWVTTDFPIITDREIDLDDCCHFNIYKQDIFPSTSLQDPGWVTELVYREGFFAWGPSIEYTACAQGPKTIHSGRLYATCCQSRSFVKPDQPFTTGDFEKFAPHQRAMDNFYRSCCRYIRKHYRKDEAGWYHGPNSDLMEKNGYQKILFGLPG